MKDYQERKAWKFNIIIHNLPESLKQTPEDRKQEDKQKVKLTMKNMKVRRKNKQFRRDLTERLKKGEKTLVIIQGKIVGFNKSNQIDTQINAE
ncbi:hypothetical protein LSH36_2010g00001 [Paralvinella palmiformis]|uniref:Uncharacterized protein n=1 Tax=Paralvinella palmiformis TaxID=53620 RepID=A0AAD9IRA2_9ANNE|nr:hypothetical protein LSH36_2010g00001 [Paralvinella palmiformis]